jgi:Flp pilus assembly pilin Flp
MHRFMSLVRDVLKSEQGVAAMEMGMIAAATIVAIAGFMNSISHKLSSVFLTVSSSI